ncbi:hypothetical protein ACTFIW_005960 [Dictyostelium discoideum]
MEKNYIFENSIYKDENENDEDDQYYNNNNNNNNSSNNDEIINEEYLIKKREKIETLFLYQNFQIVITELITLLYKLYNNNNNNNSPLLSSIFNTNNEENNENLTTTTTTTTTISLSNKTFESFSKCYHNCQNDTNCQCRWIMELLIQSLYEVGKPSDALKLVNRFYQDGISNTPINILILSIHLLVYLKSYNESKVIIIEALKRNRNEFKSDQYEQLIELLIFHVMFRMNEINESISLLQNDSYLSDWKKNGFIKALYEMVQIREFEEKNQRELQLKRDSEKLQQQQQQQQQNQQQNQQQLEKQLMNEQQQQQQQESNNSSQQPEQLPIKTQSNISIIKDIINESIHEILSIRDLKSLKLAINRVLFGNFKKLLYFIFNNFKLVYLKFKLFYLRNKLIIKRVLPMAITIILFLIAVKRVSNSRNNNNNNNNNLINTKTLKQQQQKLNSNNKRQFGIKNVQQQQQQQPYRNSQQYQQYRQNNRSILNSNNNNSNNNSTANWGGLKQLLSNTFSFNRV